MSTSVQDPNTGLGLRTHPPHSEDSVKVFHVSSPQPAPITSDATESSESTCGPSISPPPNLRKRGSSWSLATEGKPVERKAKRKEAPQGSAVEEDETAVVPQHETVEQSACEIEFASMAGQSKGAILKRLNDTAMRGNLTVINMSRRGLGAGDAGLVKQAIIHNTHLAVLKLSYNDLGDEGTGTIASGFVSDNRHHGSLSVLDLGFNGVGEEGCAALALHAVAGNYVLRTLFLTGNNVREKGALSLAGAILHGSSLSNLHLTANQIGTVGVKALTRAIAECEARNQVAVPPGDNGKFAAIPTVQELRLCGTAMSSAGFLSVTNMVLTNFSLRVLCLSDNGIDDNDMALFSQSIGQNKGVPLEVLQLSFNQITCLGVECLMNAVWGSKTLREIKLDHNRIGDRGAQLAAVVLTSIDLEVLDVGFNRIGSLGIKALMKSLSENNSLQSLTLSGIPLDPSSSKAVCYALAYNRSLRAFHVDSCSIGYAAQRHIVAGVVSNQHASLRVMTGFRLGAIAVTLGLPNALESWTNNEILTFVRLMWDGWCRQQTDRSDQMQLQRQQCDNDEDQSLSTTLSSEGPQSETTLKSEPADPKTVVAASKLALLGLGESQSDILRTESYQREKAETSPLIPADATLLERTVSGTVRIPSWSQFSHSEKQSPKENELLVSTVDGPKPPENAKCSDTFVTTSSLDNVNRKRNLRWLRKYFWVLNEIAQLPFDDADFLKLQRHFYSQPDIAALDDTGRFDRKGELLCDNVDQEKRSSPGSRSSLEASGFKLSGSLSKKTSSVSKLSYTQSGSATDVTDTTSSSASLDTTTAVSSKRHSSSLTDDEDHLSVINDMEPASKRFKNSELRISQYPRVWEKLESQRATYAQDRALALMRQLRYLENERVHRRFEEDDGQTGNFAPFDIEMILLDLT